MRLFNTSSLLLLLPFLLILVQTSVADSDVGKINQDISFYHGFLASFSVIVVSELGDKTWFIAVIMSMRHSRLTVFSGAIGALALMTVLSACLGWVTQVIPRAVTYYLSTALFALFGLKMLHEGWTMSPNEGQETLEEAQAEVSKREGELDASKFEMLEGGGGVTPQSESKKMFLFTSRIFIGGGVIGHALCTGIAVIGGKIVAQRISVITDQISKLNTMVMRRKAFEGFNRRMDDILKTIQCPALKGYGIFLKSLIKLSGNFDDTTYFVERFERDVTRLQKRGKKYLDNVRFDESLMASGTNRTLLQTVEEAHRLFMVQITGRGDGVEDGEPDPFQIMPTILPLEHPVKVDEEATFTVVDAYTGPPQVVIFESSGKKHRQQLKKIGESGEFSFCFKFSHAGRYEMKMMCKKEQIGAPTVLIVAENVADERENPDNVPLIHN